MAAVKRCLVLVAAGLALSACGKPAGLDIAAKPIVQVHVLVTGDLATTAAADGGVGVDGGEVDAGEADGGGAAVDVGALPTQLRAAVVWGLQWLPEPFCVLPPASPEAATVIAAGCRDSFGFIPNRAAADAPVTPGVPATLALYTLPAADVMVGDVTGRVAYASVIVYEDRNGNGVLDLRHPQRQRRHHEEDSQNPGGPADVVHGASFISMTLPDRRVAFLEGTFNEAVAFYPRVGCAAPPKAFSLLSASGFTEAAALASSFTQQIPVETNLAACGTASLDDTIVIPLQDPAGLSELACTPNDEGGVTYYRTAPTDPVDLRNRAWACMGFPQIGVDGGAPTGQQLVVSGLVYGPSLESCKYTWHYTLRGCDNDPLCAAPSWDLTANPPAWWPCVTSP